MLLISFPAFDAGNGVLLVLLDLSAAFDTIDHSILLDRLESCCGITGSAHKWLKSYLSGRIQTVRIGDSCSDPKPLSIGVPQGSVLGPILFSIYLQPIGGIMRRHGLTYHGYADDSQIYTQFSLRSPEVLQSAITRVEVCLQEVQHWMTANKLKMNPSKTEFMIAVPRYHQASVDHLDPVLRVAGAVIRPQKQVRNLGVLFDSQMSMLPQIKNTVRTCYFHLQTISRIRANLTEEACAAAVRALILSRLDYANSLLVGVPESARHRLQLVQNDAARMVARMHRRDHITPTLKRLHWLPVKHRIDHKLLTLTFKSLTSPTAPSYLRVHKKRHARVTRAASMPLQLGVPTTFKRVGERAFDFAGPTRWNALPAKIRLSETLPQFKRNVKTFLFGQ